MDNIDNTEIGKVLKRTPFYRETTELVNGFAASESLPDLAQEAAYDLQRQWNLKDADTVMRYS